MDVLRIEQLFQDEKTLDKVLDECSADFKRIEEISKILKSRLTANPVEAKGALTELTGIYMTLSPILAIADSEEENREVRFYEVLRITIENANGKFTSASAEKQASASVCSYRRIKNIIEAYIKSTEKGISTLQSLLKFEANEMNLQTE